MDAARIDALADRLLAAEMTRTPIEVPSVECPIGTYTRKMGSEKGWISIRPPRDRPSGAKCASSSMPTYRRTSPTKSAMADAWARTIACVGTESSTPSVTGTLTQRRVGGSR